jgi:hypothetical protein
VLISQYILSAAFLYESFCAAFMCLQFGFVIFWQKDFGAKSAHKMLVKLKPGISMGLRYVLHLLLIEKS